MSVGQNARRLQLHQLTSSQKQDLREASPRSFGASQAAEKEHNERRQVITKLQDEIDERNAAVRKLKLHGRDKIVYKAETARIKEQQQDLEKLSAQGLIRMRNQDVRAKMQSIFQMSFPEASALDVFCVSNSEYWKHRQIVTEEPSLSMDVVGIRALRLRALSAPNKRSFAAVWDHWTVAMPRILYQLDNWRKQMKIPRRREVMEIVRVPIDKIPEMWNCFVDAFLNAFRFFATSVLLGRYKDLVQRSLRKYTGWAMMPPRSFLRQCQNNGVPFGRNSNGPSWCHELLQPILGIKKPWTELKKTLVERHDDFWTECNSLLSNIDDTLKDSEDLGDGALQALQENIGDKNRRIKALISDMKKATKGEIQSVTSRGTENRLTRLSRSIRSLVDDEKDGYLAKRLEVFFEDIGGLSGTWKPPSDISICSLREYQAKAAAMRPRHE